MGGGQSKQPTTPKDKLSVKVKVYAPDANSSGTTPRQQTSDTAGGRVMDLRRERPDDYLKILQPKKGPGRMEFNPDLPQSLTPKGYTKLKLMMSIASKQYQTLVRRLKKEGKLWEDPDFPASDESIKMPELKGKLEWKRPREISAKAEYFIGGTSRFDVEQGELGDCWLLAVVSSISNYPQLFNQVMIHEQSIGGPDYVGIFRARFWRYGQWVEVLVDDRLPVHRGTTRLAFMHSPDDKEFWSALLEKAYAKLNGCYFHLSGGTQSEAMEDLTGGVCESYDLTPAKRPADLVQKMMKNVQTCCLMGCSIDSNVREGRLPNGLISGHAYSVTGVCPVTHKSKTVYLVRCRNPWGGKYEWTGAWSDKSNEWNEIDPVKKRELNLLFSDDGEFWMSYDDFVTQFSKLEVCYLGQQSLDEKQSIRGKTRMEESVYAGQWEKGVSAGGCINNRSTYSTNPQFQITITDPDPDDDDDLCTVVIELMQRDVRRKVGANFYSIGYMLYKVADPQTKLLTRANLLTMNSIGRSPFINTRGATSTFRLKPGSYIIIPSTFEPNMQADFILRVLTQVPVIEERLDNEDAMNDMPDDVQEALRIEEELLNEGAEVEEKFKSLCDKATGSIDAIQLMKILNESTLRDVTNFQGFNIEMCRSLVAAVDRNLTGSIDQSEFRELFKFIQLCKLVFFKFDVDQSGAFTETEYREAMTKGGFSISNKVFHAMVLRYRDPASHKVPFEDFIFCCVRLRNIFETVENQPKTADGVLQFTADDFMRFSVYI